MTPDERQKRIVRELLQFEDAHERLSYVQDRIKRSPALGTDQRIEVFRIQGCATPVWMVPSYHGGRCSFTLDSTSQMVRGLASLIIEVYTESTPLEICEFQSDVLAAAGLERRITSTRLHGIAQLEAAIKRFAGSCL